MPARWAFVGTWMGIGMLAGTLVITAWGRGKRKIHTIMAATLIALSIPPLRRVEVELLDHDLVTRSAIQAQLAE